MKYLRSVGLLAVAAAALMAFAGAASATTLTPIGTTTIHATAGETTLHGFATVTCASSTVSAHVSDPGGAGKTVKGDITALSYSNCLPNHVTVLTNGTGAKGTGTLEVHADPTGATGDGTLTSNGTRITIQNTDLGISCLFETQNSQIGTLDGGGTNPIFVSTLICPRVGHSFFCGSNGVWTGSYTVNSPHNLEVH